MSGRLRELWHRLHAPFRRQRLDDELAEDLAVHLEMAVEEHVRAGLEPAEARRRALVALGGIAQVAERHRDARGLPWVDALQQDVQYAVRTLRKSAGFTAVAVTMLALGIGANTAIFSLVSAVLLRPLPFPESARLVLLWDDFSARGGPTRVEPAPADYVTWKTRSRSFEDMAMVISGTYNLTGRGIPVKLAGVRATANLFQVLGMRAILGRPLAPYDEAPEAGPVVVLSERLWRSRFGGDPAIVGQSIVLNGLSRTVVGIVPPDFQFPDKNPALWVPGRFSSEELAQRATYSFDVLARLKPGVTLGQAQAEMSTIARRVAEERPDNRNVGAAVAPLHEHLTRTARPALLMLLGAVGLVLVIACANVSSLLLTRGAGRGKELALRQALGASRGRLFRQLLTESAVLAGLGVGLGTALSTMTFSYLTRLMPEGLPSSITPSLDLRVLAFSAAVTALMVLGFGTGPALVATRVDLEASLRSGTGRGAGAMASGRLRRALVVAEMTLTVVLLVSAGLLLRSYAAVLAVDPGFQAQRLLVAETMLSPARYGTLASRSSFYQRVLAHVRALPGVSSAAYGNDPPLLLRGGRTPITIEGRPAPSPGDVMRYVVSDRVASEGYFQTLGVPVVRGRTFDERDGPDGPLAVVINEKMADTFWSGEDPIGHRITIGLGAAPWYTIVGVVGTMHQTGLDVPPEPEMYVAATQSATKAPFFWPQYLVVRTSGDPMGLASAVQQAVWRVDPEQPVSNVRSMADVVDAELLNRNTQLTLVAAFAGLAVFMASIGLYGVLAYSVGQRTTEIAVRMALGAPRATVVGGVVRSALGLAVAGVALGLAGAFAATRLMAAFLFQVSPTDPATFAGVSLLLVAVAAVAGYAPARRAATVDPASVLRAE